MGPIRWCPMNAAPADAVALARDVIAAAGRHLAAGGQVDDNQVAAYDLAHAAAAVETAAAAVDYGEHGDVERRIAAAFVADAVHDVAHAPARERARVGGRARGPRRRPRLGA